MCSASRMTIKFDCTPDGIKIEKISRFLKDYEPHF